NPEIRWVALASSWRGEIASCVPAENHVGNHDSLETRSQDDSRSDKYFRRRESGFRWLSPIENGQSLPAPPPASAERWPSNSLPAASISSLPPEMRPRWPKLRRSVATNITSKSKSLRPISRVPTRSTI